MYRSLIFSTDIPSKDRLHVLTPRLNAILGNGNWIIDLDDRERRMVVACIQGTSAKSILEQLREVGIAAEFITDLPSYC